MELEKNATIMSKVGFIVFLVVLLMVPLFFISDLINERKTRQTDAI